jgi:hypothetical protein
MGSVSPDWMVPVLEVSKLRNSLPNIKTEYLSFSVCPAEFLSVLINLGFLMWEFFFYFKNQAYVCVF